MYNVTYCRSKHDHIIAIESSKHVYNRIDTMPTFYGQTDRQTDGQKFHINIARQYADTR